ncbi:MAG TPA: transposase [Candidatus Paenibacillus intestinavium]|nr:transposase [Candidatus Paenibacillus intestinavium]
MMALKLKHGYNVKIAMEGQYTLIPFLVEIERDYFELPEHIVADAGYGSEQNNEDILTKRQSTPLITHAHSLHEQKKKTKTNPFHTSNWAYDVTDDSYTCPNNKKVAFVRHTFQNDKAGFQRDFKLYECEDCTDCSFRLDCTKAEAGAIYRQRKIDVEPVFTFLKANLGFTRLNLRGKRKVEHDICLALMAVNLRKYVRRA